VPTDTPVPPPPTDTPVPPALFVQIVAPSDGASINGLGQTRFQAIAYDPAIGTTDGAGITSVDFSLVQLSGGAYSFSSSDNGAQYCAFGGNGPCGTAPAWGSMASGTYRLTATANASGKPSVTASVTFTKP
jgi:hypothetical protein